MKKYLLMFMFPALIAFTGCSNDDGNNDGDDNNGGDPAVSATTISAKWEISDPQSLYASFEFTLDGMYIAVERTTAARGNESLPHGMIGRQADATRSSNLSPVHTGKYTVDGNKITLTGFGVLEIIKITKEEFNFSFTLQSGDQGSFIASKADEPISSSSRTDMLCHSWKFAKYTIDEEYVSTSSKESDINEYGENWKAILEEEKNEEMKGYEILFSKAGTYLVLYGNGKAGLSEWKWGDSSETKLHYSWDNWENDDWEEDIVYIQELTATKLIIREMEDVSEFNRSN